MKKYVLSALVGLLISMSIRATQQPSLEVVAKIASPDFSGVVVTPEGRIFLGFPRHAIDHKGPTFAEYKNGTLSPFPNHELTFLSNRPWSEQLVSPHGMTLDAQGRMWLIDDGKRAGIAGIPDGAAKVVGFDLKTGRMIAKVIIHVPALLNDSHLNDLRIDLTHGEKGMAYIADSSFGTSPALIVVDLAKGTSRRVLTKSLSTQNESGYMAFLEGIPHAYDPKHPTFPVGGADGITLSKDSQYLYWTPLTGRRMYRINTALLADPKLTDEELAKAVVDEGERPSCDGIDTDSKNRIYFGAYEQQSIVRKNPNGQFELVVHDSRLTWPDALFINGDYLYITNGQWNRLAVFNEGHDLRKPPFLLFRVRIQN